MQPNGCMSSRAVAGYLQRRLPPSLANKLGVSITTVSNAYSKPDRLSTDLRDQILATAKDLAESVHPHPTLSETLSECAESFYGYATHTYAKKKATTEQ